MAPPFSSPSATIIILLFFVSRHVFFFSNNSCKSPLRSGIRIASAPQAIADLNAIKPASRPITSTTKTRS